MKVDDVLFDVLDHLGRDYSEVEVLAKRGRSRTALWTVEGQTTSLRREEGWAVRAGDARRSFHYAATGSPRPGQTWPEADGQGLRLPSARPISRFSPSSTLDAPLIGESEAQNLFEGLARELDNELPGARLLRGHLDDGSAETQLASSRELAAVTRHRVAVLYLEAVAPGEGLSSVQLAVAERDARRLNPKALARRLVDRLSIHSQGEAPIRDRGDFLLAPDVMVALLGALMPLWVGPEAEARARPLLDRQGRLGSRSFTLIDNGRLAEGLLAAPVDGEGQPTREVVLIDEGLYRQPLLSWWQTLSRPERSCGCCTRPGWRDLPLPGPSHLYLRPSSTRVVELLNEIRRGYYLLGVDGAPRIDLDEQRFAVPVSGFALDGGRASSSLTGAWLVGTLPSLLTGLRSVARDLTFSMHGGGMIGAPTSLVRGLELRQRP